ncbi:glycoside hydrolase family 35 protein [Aspergillus lucknowensis]|uniref:Beta-galactosidase n=1 Tax=Aspergillus lucknowensis TaxID=176173 RepID=A0ABR4L8Y8_9EURO
MKLVTGLAALAALAAAATASEFSYDDSTFYIDDQPLQIIGGQVDPQRVPRAYWKDRLEKAKAMGLNTIFSYIYWNELEPSSGEFDWEGADGINDIAAWYEAIQEAELWAVLRPGPYVCGEREWGGLPAWLSQIPDMEVRANNEPFLDASRSYLNALGEKLAPYLVTQGGPILMVQVENEYGNYGSDHDYTSALADIVSESFDAANLYTTDGGSQEALAAGAIPGALAAVDGVPSTSFDARNQFVTDSSSLGPLLEGEYWIKWYTVWGPAQGYPTVSGLGRDDAGMVDEIKTVISDGNHINLYMWHGGTNFAYGNGGLDWGTTQPFTTSYDYGAPLDEAGRPTSLYDSIRTVIQDHLGQTLPDVPESPPLMSIDTFDLTPVSLLFDDLPEPTSSDGPVTMEALGQSRGFVLYEYAASGDLSGALYPGDKARDRVIVYVNDVKQGVIDHIYQYPPEVSVTLAAGDKLSLLVENLGRVDYGPAVAEQQKGIVGDIKVGDATVTGWDIYSLPAASPPSNSTGSGIQLQDGGSPAWYTGSFESSGTGAGADTFLQLDGAVKGVVWVNGFNLGRYWTVGPQQQLYLPGCVLKEGTNQLVVLELEPQTGVTLSASGVTERTWGNNPDPDCSGCQ